MRHHVRQSLMVAVALVVTPVALFAVFSFARAATSDAGGTEIAPRILAGPSVDPLEVTDSTAVIRWTTDVASTTVVNFGTTSALDDMFRKIVPIEESEVMEINHSMTLWGLDPGTLYFYQAHSETADKGEAKSAVGTFITTGFVEEPETVKQPIITLQLPEEALDDSTIGGKVFAPFVSVDGSIDEVAITVVAEDTNTEIGKFSGELSSDENAVQQWVFPVVTLESEGRYRLMAEARYSLPASLGGTTQAVVAPVVLIRVNLPEEPIIEKEDEVADTVPETLEPEDDVVVEDHSDDENVPDDEGFEDHDDEREFVVTIIGPGEVGIATPVRFSAEIPPGFFGMNGNVVDASGYDWEIVSQNQLVTGDSDRSATFSEEAGGTIVARFFDPGGYRVEVRAWDEFGTSIFGMHDISVRKEEEGMSDRLPSETDPVRAGLLAMGLAVDDTDDLAHECEEEGVREGECLSWQRIKYANRTCADLGLLSKESCSTHLMTRNGGVFPGCEALSADECKKVRARVLVSYLPEAVKERADEQIKEASVEGRVVSYVGLSAVADRVTEKAIWWPSFEEGKQTSPAMVIFDADKDGLPDAFEVLNGTDPENRDTDGDGVGDLEEFQAGTNPLGGGTLQKEFSPLEKVLIDQQPIEQPRGAGTVDDAFVIALSAGTKDGASNGVPESLRHEDRLSLHGTAEPNSVVTIFVYSYIPVVYAATTDEYGDFTVELGDSVVDGDHEVYVVLTDATGRVEKKSSPLSFFVREARAISQDELLDLLTEDRTLTIDEAGSADKRRYLYGAVLLIIIGIGAVILVVARSTTPLNTKR